MFPIKCGELTCTIRVITLGKKEMTSQTSSLHLISSADSLIVYLPKMQLKTTGDLNKEAQLTC